MITLGNRLKKADAVWDISPDSTLLGVTDTWMKSVFAQLALVFPQFWVFEAIFEARGQNFPIFKNSVCTFYCTQNDRLDPTVSMQKSVWKSDHRRLRNLQNYFSTWHAKPNHNLILFFLNYLGLGWSVFQTNFCIETVGSRRSFWVQ